MKKYKIYYIMVLCAILLVLIGILIYILILAPKKNQISLVFKEIEVIEYGDHNVTSKSMIKEYEGDSIKYPKLDVMSIGKQKLVYTVKKGKDTKDFTFIVEVKDTKKPEIKLKKDKVILTQGEHYDLTDNVEAVKDPIDGNLSLSKEKKKGAYTISSDLDLSKAARYTVQICAYDKNGNMSKRSYTIEVREKTKAEPNTASSNANHVQDVQPTYINGVLLVNKQHALPRSFGGYHAKASTALSQLQAGANAAGYAMPLISGYRSYEYQATLYQNYVAIDGQAAADRYSARPGTSEHQTGMAFDIGVLDDNFGYTPAGQWLAAHAHEYGFIIRYPQGKEHITGYMYEPWHVRYLGVDIATSVYRSNLTLEEYLGVY